MIFQRTMTKEYIHNKQLYTYWYSWHDVVDHSLLEKLLKKKSNVLNVLAGGLSLTGSISLFWLNIVVKTKK